jgi:hypothetical protein
MWKKLIFKYFKVSLLHRLTSAMKKCNSKNDAQSQGIYLLRNYESGFALKATRFRQELIYVEKPNKGYFMTMDLRGLRVVLLTLSKVTFM